MTEAICAHGLGFTYHGASRPALADVDLMVATGEVVGLLGPSGAGKSTLQRVLTGLLTGYRGSARVLGREISRWGREVYERIGVAFETPIAFGRLTLRENLAYTARLYVGSTREPEELLDAVDLAEDADMRAAHMSKGMGVRFNVARALLHEPELIFLDEPTAGLDPVRAQRMARLIAAERVRGHTLVITTHDMDLAHRACDRVGFIVEGRLVELGEPDTLCRRHGTREVHVAWDGGEALFPLDGLAENAGFHEVLRTRDVRALHSREADLAEVFAAVTGREL
ncbi:ABC transporter ATP-binding protein [Propionibacterium australiense]|uniref:ABC transporter-like n=1 Tax=Propionibacterium australiense TaxID=119981 RepID=A0A383S4T6_9ACTN|nr:ABC transporter ATP-binding protein [Propionibacterium australiense]RLP10014.1 ATP-binding cassette domain-containing protein [Propionibacterium australiense]RLP11299.1 ATP-binding cassette domain-containing protein [Propionibacterium australiense]SYZ32927.1 ABC transporter-like [Propionibacterium australiense]VEH92415.1 Fluoroquinolones export ATP-binding protein Rv2688c/MT2762 [Propionibacterium australiense]